MKAGKERTQEYRGRLAVKQAERGELMESLFQGISINRKADGGVSIDVSFTPAEHKAVSDMAAKQGLSLDAFMMELIGRCVHARTGAHLPVTTKANADPDYSEAGS